MAVIEIGILKESKIPPDKKVPFTPIQCKIDNSISNFRFGGSKKSYPLF